MIVVIDYGMGNVGSILNMIRRAGGEGKILADPSAVGRAEKLILPGVGAFDTAMFKLRQTGLREALDYAVIERQVPILGICLGAQLFTRRSEEGYLPGLGWIAADTIRFRFDDACRGLKLPHMGWNRIEVAKEDRLLSGPPVEQRFYFVHSFHLVCDLEEDILTRTTYGYSFTSAIRHKNIWGTQFHPEKSHKYGLALMKNFVELT